MGVLSIGTEDNKGNELTLGAFELCKQLTMNFVGNVEGHDLFENRVDVVVCDGFVGNIVLKTCESLAKAMFSHAEAGIEGQHPRASWARCWPNTLFARSRSAWTPKVYGGAPLLGFNGSVMKAHGSARERAIANAIRVAARISNTRSTLPSPAKSPAPTNVCSPPNRPRFSDSIPHESNSDTQPEFQKSPRQA